MALEDGSGCNWRDLYPDLVITHNNNCGRNLIFERADLALQAAICGQGLALGRTFICLDEIERGNLVAPFGIKTRMKWGYYLVSRKSIAEWPKFVTFKDWLFDELQKIHKRAKSLEIWYD